MSEPPWPSTHIECSAGAGKATTVKLPSHKRKGQAPQRLPVPGVGQPRVPRGPVCCSKEESQQRRPVGSGPAVGVFHQQTLLLLSGSSPLVQAQPGGPSHGHWEKCLTDSPLPLLCLWGPRGGLKAQSDTASIPAFFPGRMLGPWLPSLLFLFTEL